jgi:hypothetical protein
MHPDPTLDHVREVRHRISEQCAHDPNTTSLDPPWAEMGNLVGGDEP